jgi:undecaprenyl-diphosphatase
MDATSLAVPHWLATLILGLVEGLTEFLPISSTGHLIVVGDLLHYNDEKGKVFEIVIQLGAILAVCWEYRARIAETLAGMWSPGPAQRLAVNLAIAFVPAGVMGALFAHYIKAHLFNPVSVACALIVGAFVIFAVERRKRVPAIDSVDDMSPLTALLVGCAQAVALIPGTSRAAATIMGGLLTGMSRRAATEFSFFLAIPTMFAATAYDTFKHRDILHFDDLGTFAFGFVVAFLSALVAVRALLRYIARHDFNAFAWYRIGFGILILAFFR